MARDAFDVRIALDEVLKHLVLLLVVRLERHTVLPVALAVVLLVLPEVVGLDAEQHVHVGQALRAEVPRLVPGPEIAAEVAVEADRHPLLLCRLHAVQDQVLAAAAEGRRDAGQVQPVEAIQKLSQVHAGEIILRDRAVLAVIDDLGGADPVAGLQIIGPQPVGRRLGRRREDHRRAVHVIGAQPADRALAQTVVGYDSEKGAVHAQIGKGQRDVRLAPAVAGFKARGHADLLIVGRGQAQHDLADRDEFGGLPVPCQQRIVVFHICAPSRDAAVPVRRFVLLVSHRIHLRKTIFSIAHGALGFYGFSVFLPRET